jgi:hypothetical protein
MNFQTSNTKTSIDMAEARLAAALPDEVHAIAAMAEGARRWAESGGQLGEIRRVIVTPQPSWCQWATKAEYDVMRGYYKKAIDRCAKGEPPAEGRPNLFDRETTE